MMTLKVLRRSISMAVMFAMLSFVQCSNNDDNPVPVTPTSTPTPDPVVKIPAIAPTDCSFVLDEDSLTKAGWTKTFEDNFDGDLAKWNVWTGGAFNNELEYYQESNLEVVDGKLIIHGKREKVTGATNPYDNTQKSFDFTSGRIESKTNVSSSANTPKVRMMARIKLPKGKGLWPAFWAYGDPWPTHGEIDILEMRGSDTTKYQTNYFFGTSAGTNLVSGAEKVITADNDLTTCYHVYELIWEGSKLTSILDGTIVEIKTSGGYISQMYGQQQHIVLNMAMGGLFFSNLNADDIAEGSMEVDWVKVYTH